MENRPVNRFWACFFASSIFGFLWVRKMEKTRKWILLYIVSTIALIGISGILLIPDETVSAAYLIWIVGGYVVIPILHIFYMYRWATEYNIIKYGNKSQKDWIKENENNTKTDEPDV